MWTFNFILFAHNLARLVFIKYDNIGNLLVPSEEQRRVTSHVVSATIGDKQHNDTLVKPVTFTLSTSGVSRQKTNSTLDEPD